MRNIELDTAAAIEVHGYRWHHRDGHQRLIAPGLFGWAKEAGFEEGELPEPRTKDASSAPPSSLAIGAAWNLLEVLHAVKGWHWEARVEQQSDRWVVALSCFVFAPQLSNNEEGVAVRSVGLYLPETICTAALAACALMKEYRNAETD